MAVEQDILDLERAFWLEGGGNPDFWREHFADDGVVALSIGVMDKDRTVTAMEQAAGWQQIDFEDVRFVHENDTAVMAYRATGRRVGDDSDYVAVVMSVYVRRAGDWLLAAHQQTPIP